MHAILAVSIAIPALWIIYAYPIIATLRDRLVSDVVGKSWAMQIFFFTFVCIGVPVICHCLNEQVGRDLALLVPDTPHLVPVYLGGWLTPLIVCQITCWLRAAILRRRKLTDEQ